MKLLELVKELPEGSTFTIGAQTAWLYFGNREDYLKRYKHFDNYYHRNTERLFKQSESDYNRILKLDQLTEEEYNKKPQMKKINTGEKNEDGMFIFKRVPVDYQEFKDNLHFQFIAAEKVYKSKLAYINFYEKISDREVVRAYRKHVDTSIGIVVTGNEEGPYWFKSEWEEHYGR